MHIERAVSSVKSKGKYFDAISQPCPRDDRKGSGAVHSRGHDPKVGRTPLFSCRTGGSLEPQPRLYYAHVSERTGRVRSDAAQTPGMSYPHHTQNSRECCHPSLRAYDKESSITRKPGGNRRAFVCLVANYFFAHTLFRACSSAFCLVASQGA